MGSILILYQDYIKQLNRIGLQQNLSEKEIDIMFKFFNNVKDKIEEAFSENNAQEAKQTEEKVVPPPSSLRPDWLCSEAQLRAKKQHPKGSRDNILEVLNEMS